MQIAMRDDEISLFETFLRQANSYMEFGTGGSTVLAANTVKGPIQSVDSSRDWLTKVEAELATSVYPRRLLYADIGPTGNWGAPLDKSNPDLFLNYHEAIWENADQKFDLYLVDGRFRVACFCQIVMRAPADAIIAMHDYRSRSPYHAVESVARPIAETSDLTFFVKKINVGTDSIRDLIGKFKYNWA